MATNGEKTPAQLWVEALRGGEYKQTRYYLHNSSGYCCLGVLCELYQKHIAGLKVEALQPDGTMHKEPYWAYDNEWTWLPKPVLEWAGLRDGCGTYQNSECDTALYFANDRGDSFAKIADIIESRPPGLFTEDATHAN